MSRITVSRFQDFFTRFCEPSLKMNDVQYSKYLLYVWTTVFATELVVLSEMPEATHTHTWHFDHFFIHQF